MKFRLNLLLASAFVFAATTVNVTPAEAGFGLFAKLFGKKCCEPAPECCEPEPVCCEPEPEPVCCEPVCCEPEPEPVCCEPEPMCCEPEPEPVCCEPEPEPCCEPEPAPEPCCASSYPLPTLNEGEVLLSISPILHPVSPAATTPAATSLVALRVTLTESLR